MNEQNTRLLARYAAHPMREQIKNTLAVGEAYAEHVSSIKGDKTLSASGSADRVHAQTRFALRDIRDHLAPIAELQAQRASILARIKPIGFDKGDFSGAVLRGQMRAAIKGMALPEQAKVLLGAHADPELVDAVLEGPALLSGVESQAFEKVREQRLKTLFPQEHLQVEDLQEKIASANAAREVAHGDLLRESGLQPHQFLKLVDEVYSKRGAIWLRREIRNGEARTIVIPPRGGPSRPATPDEIRDGKFYRDFAEYQADRAA